MMRNFGPKNMLQIFFGPFQSPFPTPNSLRQCDQILQIWLILANFKIVAILKDFLNISQNFEANSAIL